MRRCRRGHFMKASGGRCIACQRRHQQERWTRYNGSAKARIVRQRYEQTDKAKKRAKRYRETLKGAITAARKGSRSMLRHDIDRRPA